MLLSTLRKTLNRREVRESWQRLTRTEKVNINETERLWSLTSGLALALYGLVRRSSIGVSALFAGGYLIYRGLTGHCPAYEAMNMSSASRTERLQFKAGDKRKYDAEPESEPTRTVRPDSDVDETGWETFPASDPPAWTATRIGQASN